MLDRRIMLQYLQWCQIPVVWFIQIWLFQLLRLNFRKLFLQTNMQHLYFIQPKTIILNQQGMHFDDKVKETYE